LPASDTALPIRSVCPSGALLATNSVPMLPLAPLRLSTTKGWPRVRAKSCATRRATMSTLPPAGKGTTTRTGRSG
jgi:hypothetical protein